MDQTDADAHDDRPRSGDDPTPPVEFGDALEGFLSTSMGRSVSATRLVHEVAKRMTGPEGPKPGLKARAERLAEAATALRQLLVTEARAGRTLGIHDAFKVTSTARIDIMALDRALEVMAEMDARQARVVELRVFGGLTDEETAFVLGRSLHSVERDWKMGRTWLRRALTKGTA